MMLARDRDSAPFSEPPPPLPPPPPPPPPPPLSDVDSFSDWLRRADADDEDVTSTAESRDDADEYDVTASACADKNRRA